uniref:Uncharacterized protein n=1 Tax=Parascaris equorum TaxID=6256 RepID=A0A914R371_PAREQ
MVRKVTHSVGCFAKSCIEEQCELLKESQSASGLADLTYNYLNERIAELFYDTSFTEPIELYDREQVEVDIEKPTLCPHQITRLIDQKQQLVQLYYLHLKS